MRQFVLLTEVAWRANITLAQGLGFYLVAGFALSNVYLLPEF